jgi:FAD/FMN-containing dehydrogenase
VSLRDPADATPVAAVLADLRGRLPEGTLSTDPDLLAGHQVDLTGRFAGTASALARPRDREQVATIVAACAAHGLPLVPQGGNTGMVGGGVPRDGELVLSLARLDSLGEVDVAAGQIVAGAGVSLERVQDAARAAGFEFPLDFGARSAATVGGMIATDAGGSLALAHGTMRRRVVGLEAVLADGTVVGRMGGLMKDNAGYDLPALLIGSEGTLGVVTAARLALEPAKPLRVAALFGVGSLAAGLDLLAALRRVPGLEAADFLDAACMRLVEEQRGIVHPLGADRATPADRPGAKHPFYVLAQWAGERDPLEEIAAAVAGLAPEPPVAVADGAADRERLWAGRELINESIRERGVPHKLDVAVPPAALPELDRRLRELIGAVPGASLYLYGHLGDGNAHVNVLGPDPEDESVDAAVLRLVAELGGTISAEHGVGVAKTKYLSLCRSEGEIEAMRRLKAALDPGGILAPGRILV